MKLAGLISMAVLSLTLVAVAPVYAQDQHEKQEEKAKPEEKKAQPPEKKAEQEKSAKAEDKGAQQQEKNNKQEQKTAQQHAQQAKPEQHAAANESRRIPQDRYKANFGREHTFHVSQAEYSGGRRFQYGGYWLGFQDAWPSNWLYTQDVFVVEINGMYYLCNPSYPGVNIALNVTM